MSGVINGNIIGRACMYARVCMYVCAPWVYDCAREVSFGFDVSIAGPRVGRGVASLVRVHPMWVVAGLQGIRALGPWGMQYVCVACMSMHGCIWVHVGACGCVACSEHVCM